MDKIGERAVIRYLHEKGFKPNDIHNDMVATLGKDAPSYATLKGGWQNLSAADRASRMTPVLEGLSLLKRQKWSIKSMIL